MMLIYTVICCRIDYLHILLYASEHRKPNRKKKLQKLYLYTFPVQLACIVCTHCICTDELFLDLGLLILI